MTTGDAPVVDRDEHGEPVRDEYRRLGASGNTEGLFVRFEPGFGLNVHIGWRTPIFDGPLGTSPTRYEDREGITMSGQGWERIGEFVDEWRQRRTPAGDQ